MEILLGEVAGRNGHSPRGRPIPCRERTVGQNAWGSGLRVLWELISAHYGSGGEIPRRITGPACVEGTNRQLRDGQILCVSEWGPEEHKASGNSDSNGHEQAIFILPVQNCSARICAPGPCEIKYVVPAGISVQKR